MVRPRFFERATPNQMLADGHLHVPAGRALARISSRSADDYSRFIVGADLFRSPTAEAVIEVYRVAQWARVPASSRRC